MSNSLNDWLPMDSLVEDPTAEVHYRIAIPVYGKVPSIFDVSSTPNPMPKGIWPDKLKRQLLNNALRPGFHKTFDEHLEWFMASTEILHYGGHSLVKTGEGLYEVRRGGKSYANQLPELKYLYGRMVEVGYPSRKADFSGVRVRKPRAYAGWVDRIGVGYLRLNCGNGKYRRMSLEKIAWWAPVSGDAVGNGIFHHEYLEVSFLRGRGGRLHIRVIHTGPDENFAVKLPPPEFESNELRDDDGSAKEDLAVDELLRSMRDTLEAGILSKGLQEHRELAQLKAYIERMSKGFKVS